MKILSFLYIFKRSLMPSIKFERFAFEFENFSFSGKDRIDDQKLHPFIS